VIERYPNSLSWVLRVLTGYYFLLQMGEMEDTKVSQVPCLGLFGIVLRLCLNFSRRA
jgi:hypothetical protein